MVVTFQVGSWRVESGRGMGMGMGMEREDAEGYGYSAQIQWSSCLRLRVVERGAYVWVSPSGLLL